MQRLQIIVLCDVDVYVIGREFQIGILVVREWSEIGKKVEITNLFQTMHFS